MNGSKLLSAIAAGTTLSLIAMTGTAQAFTIGGHLNGQEFDDLGLDIPWAAESRIGRVGDHELNIHDHTNSAQNRVQANYDNWVSGEAVDFSLVFDSVLDTLTYTVAGIELSKTEIFEDNFSDLYIRTTARKEGTSMVVDNLFLQDEVMGSSIAETSSASCSGGVGCGYFDSEYLHIGNIVGDFTLTGQSTMSWSGTQPKNSNLAYQIKLVEGGGSVDVPEPASMSLFSLSALGLVVTGLRRRSA